MGFKQNLLEITADNIYKLVQKLMDPKCVAFLISLVLWMESLKIKVYYFS